MKVQYTIRIEAELLEQAKKAAEKEMRSLNNLIEYAIKRFMESKLLHQEDVIKAMRDGVNSVLEEHN